MKIRRSSDYSISLLFNNVIVDIFYPLVRLGLTGIALKLDTEISYYKFNDKNLIKNNLSVHKALDYDFTFLLLGFGFVVSVTKDIQH